MRGSSHTEVLIITATLVVIVLVGSYFFLRSDSNLIPRIKLVDQERVAVTTSYAAAELPVDSELAQAYQEVIPEILKQYSSDSLNYGTAHIAYQAIIDELLAVSVPASYQTVHVELVLVFEELAMLTEDPDNIDLEALAEVRQQADSIIKAHHWMTE